MSKRKRMAAIVIWIVLLVITLLLSIFVGHTEHKETIKELMRDAVLHESNKISLFGLKDVNPAIISAMVVTLSLLAVALVIRIFVIPRFKIVPGKFQILLEELVSYFDKLAKSNSPHRYGFLSAYVFAAGVYIFIGTVFELFGIQAVAVNGSSMTLPAPLSDINAAIAMGCLSYLAILSGGIAGNKLRGIGNTLKDFSLPISMSFRLFGALLSGLLVTELVYYYMSLSYVLPVAVGVMFTLLHALIQTYVLTMLTALFYGEVSEPHKGSSKTKKAKRILKKADMK